MRKIISSIFSLVLVTLALIVNVYGWFAINEEATASGINVSSEEIDITIGNYSILKYNKDTLSVEETDSLTLDEYDSIFTSNNDNLAIIVVVPYETSSDTLTVTFTCSGSTDDVCISNIIDFECILPTADELESLTDNSKIYTFATSYSGSPFSFFDSSFNKQSEITSTLDLSTASQVLYLVVDYSSKLISHFNYSVGGDEFLTTFTGDLTEIRFGV